MKNRHNVCRRVIRLSEPLQISKGRRKTSEKNNFIFGSQEVIYPCFGGRIDDHLLILVQTFFPQISQKHPAINKLTAATCRAAILADRLKGGIPNDSRVAKISAGSAVVIASRRTLMQ